MFPDLTDQDYAAIGKMAQAFNDLDGLVETYSCHLIGCEMGIAYSGDVNRAFRRCE
jgi:hypothetical protein